MVTGRFLLTTWQMVVCLPHTQLENCYWGNSHLVGVNSLARRYYKQKSIGSIDNRNQLKLKSLKVKKRKSKKDLIFATNRVNQFLNWLGIAFNLCSKDLETLSSFNRSLLHIEKHKGSMFLIKYVKECRISIENYGLGSSEKKSFSLIRCRYSGLPRILGDATHLVKERKQNFINALLSLLTMCRTAKFKKSPDFSTIYSPWSGSGKLPNFIYIRFHLFLKRLTGIKI